MVVLNEGKNKIRDLLDTNLTEGQVGTDGTAVTAADTGLGAAVAGTDNPTTNTTGNKLNNVAYTLLSTEGNSNTLKEYVIRFSDGTDFVRVVFPDFPKTASEELLITHTTRIV